MLQQHYQPKSKGRTALYLLLLAAAIAAMVSLRTCPRHTGATQAPGGDTLAVAIQYSPMSFFMDGDSLSGFDYSLLRLTGMPVKIFPVTNPQEGLAGLEAGRYDMLIADLPQSVTDSTRFAYTVPAYLDRQVLVQLTDSAGAPPAITSVLELADDTVYVTRNSPMIERIANMAREIGAEIHVEQLPVTSEKLLIMQALGQIPGPTVVNAQVARSLAADYPRLDASLPVSLSQFQPWVLRRSDSALAEQVNSRLDSVKRTDAYKALTARYFPD